MKKSLHKKLVDIKTTLLVAISIILAFIITNTKGDIWEDAIREGLYKLKNDSIPSSATEYVNPKGIPYVHYMAENDVAASTQYNATIVANYAIKYYNDFIETKDTLKINQFFNCVQFLKDSVVHLGNTYLYHFNWQQGWYPNIKPPFTSGMTNGRTIDVCTKAFQLTKDSSYIFFAKKLLRAFYISIDSGSFVYLTNNGWWYEEMAKANTITPHILDGHIFAIQGVQAYYKQTNDDSAKTVIQNGLLALKNALPNYTGKEKIYYDINQKVADKKYCKILTNQMWQLWESTQDSTFLHYYNQWTKPLKKPYLFRISKEKNISGIILFVLIMGICFLAGKILLSIFRRNK